MTYSRVAISFGGFSHGSQPKVRKSWQEGPREYDCPPHGAQEAEREGPGQDSPCRGTVSTFFLGCPPLTAHSVAKSVGQSLRTLVIGTLHIYIRTLGSCLQENLVIN